MRVYTDASSRGNKSGIAYIATDRNHEVIQRSGVVIDGGDILQGSAFSTYCRQVLQSPEIIAQIMNDCGYDFYTLGNHDFNYGQEYLKEYRTSCNGICVCQNVCNDAGVSLFPYQIHTMPNGLKVGIVGIVTDYVNVWEKTENLDGICIKDPFLAVAEVLPKMKQAADVTICVYHGGFECDIDLSITNS